MNLVQCLIKEQNRLGLSDRAFARYLGVSSALWATTKQGKVQPGSKLIRKAVQKFPLLANEVIKHLSAQTVA